MFYIKVLLLFVLVASSSAFARDKDNSFYEVLALTYSNNPTIQAARAEFSAVEETLVQVKSGYLPTVTADADLTYKNTQSNGGDSTTSDGGNLSKSVGVNLNQPLYHGGIIKSGIKQAEYLVAAQGFYLSGVEQNTLFDAVVAYMDLYENQEILKLQKNNELLVIRELEQAKARFKVGELTRTDVSQSEARLAAAKASVINAQAMVKTSIATFNEVVGAPPPADITYPSIMFDIPQTLDEALTLAATNNRQILQARLSERASTYEVDVARGDLRPKLDAVGRVSQSYTPSDFVDEQSQGVIGLNASVPLYTGGATRSRIRQAKKTAMQRQAQVLAVQQSIESQVVADWEAWQAAKAQTQARVSQVEASKIAQEGVRYETEFGERTTLDALNANQELLSAQVDLTKSKQNKIVAQFALARSLGLLVPQNLGFSTRHP